MGSTTGPHNCHLGGISQAHSGIVTVLHHGTLSLLNGPDFGDDHGFEEVPMTRTKMALRVSAALGAALLGVTAATLVSVTAIASPAGAAHKVGPDQYFTGVINGTDGNTITPIPIQMACFGPSTPGETGHPLSGQTLAVHQLFPPSTDSSLGETGNDSTIEVFFGALPPAGATASTSKTASKPVSFTHYDKTKALPTKLTHPRSGTGTVYFVPIPVVPPSESQGVPVQFEPQP